MGSLEKPKLSTEPTRRTKKKEIPKGLWTKCPDCGEVLYQKELSANLRTCPHCGYHMNISAHERLAALFDKETFREYDSTMSSVDILKFKALKSYRDKIASYTKMTGLNDGVVSAQGKIEGISTTVVAMDFRFAAGSMGSVAGEKITRAFERALQRHEPTVLFSASGGARMEEGLFSLMQMAKTSGALAKLRERGLPYIVVLTNPTTGGVTASFATLGDVILAEPKAMIGFAGPRVIKETTRQDLPEGFQTAEFLLDRGLVDRIVSRKQMKTEIAQILRYLRP
ncbi:MAG: acetyl-CoA carboxylase, carboxyltransferase subunit beta [Verrucomicrobiota bacterium]